MRPPRARSTPFFALLVLATVQTANGDVRFPASVSRLGEAPADLVEADFDGDGAVDVAVSYPRAGGIGVLLGTGDGRFEQERTLPANPGVESLLVSDLDGDGKPDLAALDPERGEVSFHRGNGDGSFEAPVPSPAVAALRDLASGDIDGDGAIDLVAAHEAGRSVAWLRGDGRGGFEAPRFFDSEIEPVAIGAADFDLDGWLDAAVVGDGDGVFVLFGDGSGFGPPVRIGRESDAFIAIADLDTDGLPDLVTGSAESRVGSGLVAYLGIGGRFFADVEIPSSMTFPESVAIADFDRNGALDLVAAGGSSDGTTLAVLRGDDRGRFERVAASTWRSFFSQARLAVADVDGDGREDLLAGVGVLGHAEGDLLVFPGSGDGTFSFMEVRSAHERPSSVVAADLDEDGLIDLVTADLGRHDEGGLSVFAGLGDRSFAPAEALLSGAPHPPHAVSPVDLDADGDLDLLVLARSQLDSGLVMILRGDGSGAFDAPESIPVGAIPGAMAIGDLDRNRVPDIVLGSSAGVHILLGRRDGSFAPERLLSTPGVVRNFGVADLDGDHDIDLVVADSFRVAFYRGNGDGTFRDAIPVSSPGTVTVGNVDDDGVPDLIVTLRDAIAVRLGTGDGSFGAAELVRPAFDPGGAILDDVNRDGISDLVIPEHFGGWVSVWLGLGDGSFREGCSFRASDLIGGFAVADVDGDGASDVVATSPLLQHSVSVLFQIVDPHVDVGIDIRPGDEANLVGSGGQGALPVAVLGAEDFDVEWIDEGSLVFGPGAAPPHGRVAYRDVNSDGVLDAWMRFRQGEAGLAPGDSTACLTGRTRDGRTFSGCDAIRFVGACGLGFELALLLPGLLWLARVRRAGRVQRGARAERPGQQPC